MTTPADARTDEEAFAACLAGRPVPAGAAHLAAFTDAVRAGATAPGRPNAALAELLATGLLTDQSEPSTRTTGHPARASRKRTRMLLTTLTAKLAAAGIAAKAAAATGVVAVALTGAATTGVLPVEGDTGTAVVESADDVATEPTETAEPTDTADEGTGDEGTGGTPDDGATGDVEGDPVDGGDPGDGEQPADGEQPVDGDPVDGGPAEEPATPELTEEQWAGSPADGRSHGEWVSEGARNGWVTGERVSDAAHARNAERKAGRGAEEPVEEPVAEEPVTDEPVAEEPAVEEAAPAPAPSGGHGNGNGKGNGNGRK
jgi:hypothetical protein